MRGGKGGDASRFLTFAPLVTQHRHTYADAPTCRELRGSTMARALGPSSTAATGSLKSTPEADPELNALAAEATELVAQPRSTGWGVVDSARVEEKSYNPRSVPGPSFDPELTALAAEATELVAQPRSTSWGVVDSARVEEKSYNPRSVPGPPSSSTPRHLSRGATSSAQSLAVARRSKQAFSSMLSAAPMA